MKHSTLQLLFIAAFTFSAIFCTAQEKKDSSTEKTFHFGVGLGANTVTNDGAFGKILGVGLSLQAEKRFTPQLSMFASAGYNLQFSTEGGGTFGFIPIHAGPRYYFGKDVFIGVGLGYGVLTDQGETEGAFNYFPHFGANVKSGQFTIGYNALTKEGATIGFFDVKYIFNF
jgi:hypothetical protein